MTGLGAMMNGGKSSAGADDFNLEPTGAAPREREPDDFYRTPEECTEALLQAECGKMRLHGLLAHEFCAGDGKISGVLRRYGFAVIESDLVDRGIGADQVDFLQLQQRRAPIGFTNPPFAIADEILAHARDVIGFDYLALFLPSSFWHAGKRFARFDRDPPAAVYELTWKPDFLELGNPAMNMKWVVWRPHEGDTVFRLLRKPGGDLFDQVAK